MASPSRVLLSSVVNSSSPAVTAASQESITVDSDTVVILAALLCALICVVGLFAVVRCAWLRRSTTTILPRIPADKGLKKKVLKSLPKFTFNGSVLISYGKLSADCPICLAEFAVGDEIRVLPQCGHGFHVGCIDTWLGSHSSCPSCRQVLIVSRCNKCGGFPTASSAGETDLEVGVIAAAAGGGVKATSSTNENDNRFLP